jgi:adenylyltransferase/sulfurtransferase
MLEEIGYQGQLQLRNAKVCVVGVGGLGNPITTRLVAMGVGTLRIVDRDVIELSNLHRQTLFDESDVGEIKVEAASRKLQKLNSNVKIEALPISVNDYTALEVVDGCDVVIDALDSVNARYSLNRACIKKNIPFVTGAAVGVSGQAFTILPKHSACYHCMFPSLDEDSMPTCSIEGVHPSILSIIGGIEVAEAVKIILGKKPSLADRILHVDLENLDFVYTKTFKVDECPVCAKRKNDS